ncbi:MAG TPA: restriction endonuclease [Anaerolineae bacterium]|nr:restriction endonuclease [Anaerolineae bacterium]
MIPDFQSTMLPLLRLAKDGGEHTLREAIESLAEHFELKPAERRELLPSGRQSTFDNRVGWASTYLKKAGLLESTGRGRFRITSRGLEVLEGEPPAIDVGFLQQFPEFVDFRSRSSPTDQAEPAREADQTPEEVIESGYQALRNDLAEELLEQVMSCSPQFFEKLVVDLLVEMGYGGSRKDAGQAVGQSGDAGIDGIIKEDKLGLDVVYVQAKRWANTVGRPVVQSFAGSLEGQGANKGVLITTSDFSNGARDYVGRIQKKIVLIDGRQLADLMIDHGIGVSDVTTYTLRQVDTDYFSEG